MRVRPPGEEAPASHVWSSAPAVMGREAERRYLRKQVPQGVNGIAKEQISSDGGAGFAVRMRVTEGSQELLSPNVGLSVRSSMSLSSRGAAADPSSVGLIMSSSKIGAEREGSRTAMSGGHGLPGPTFRHEKKRQGPLSESKGVFRSPSWSNMGRFCIHFRLLRKVGMKPTQAVNLELRERVPDRSRKLERVLLTHHVPGTPDRTTPSCRGAAGAAGGREPVRVECR